MKRKFLLPLIILSVSAMGLTAGTWAQFTDTKAFGPNTITAGSFSIAVSGTDFNVTDATPGDCATQPVTVTNNGTKASAMTLQFAITDNGTGNLSQYLDMTVSSPTVISGLPNTLSNLNGVSFPDGFSPIDASPGTRVYDVQWCVDPAAPNAIEGDHVTFNLNFTGTESLV